MRATKESRRATRRPAGRSAAAGVATGRRGTAIAGRNGRRGEGRKVSAESMLDETSRYPVGNMVATRNAAELAQLVERTLVLIGEDPSREGLQKTPERVARSLAYLTRGYDQNPYEVLGDAVFTERYDEMVLVRDIDVFSLCEHHLLPFVGRCHVAYIPRQKIAGLSKIARLVEIYARRLQVQERMTREIGRCIEEVLVPEGVGVVIEAYHMCMMMRGIEKQNSVAVTSCMLGSFRKDPKVRMEFLELIRTRSRNP
jgi:GTP cyclohydrolase IA